MVFKEESCFCKTSLHIKNCKQSIYVVSKGSDLCIDRSQLIHHSDILKEKKGDELYSYRKLVVCTEHLDIKNSRVNKTSNDSVCYQQNQ